MASVYRQGESSSMFKTATLIKDKERCEDSIANTQTLQPPRIPEDSQSSLTADQEYNQNQNQNQNPIPIPIPNIDTIVQSPANFPGFFTLIAPNAHPTLHYLFADDSPDLLTEACLAALNSRTPISGANVPDLNPNFFPEEQGPKEPAEGEQDFEERVLVVDIVPTNDAASNDLTRFSELQQSSHSTNAVANGAAMDTIGNPDQSGSQGHRAEPETHDGGMRHGNMGYRVKAASSLSPNWQILSATVEQGPSFEGVEGGPMLRINGTEGYTAVSTGHRRDGSSGSSGSSSSNSSKSKNGKEKSKRKRRAKAKSRAKGKSKSKEKEEDEKEKEKEEEKGKERVVDGEGAGESKDADEMDDSQQDRVDEVDKLMSQFGRRLDELKAIVESNLMECLNEDTAAAQ